MPTYNLTINGEQKSVEALEDMPLLWVIRDLLDLKGTKFGCGQALCGACTVHLDGTAIRSCSLPISEVGNAQITTIEGLSENGDHPLQQAWVEHIVPQCGYCQTGQIMNAASLLQSNPNPSEEEIEQSMAGNLCRCGTYNRIKTAIQTAAKNL
ncbi:MAG TPA: (2Fe-2S)-binding protein [Algoriphagus sp.]|mgnify:FL=1|jgi:isoquinoline 1-oxidoreductase alpha subunit|uniref:(2Fe-2S)-binding protein n=1 Tax=unclassified Algoriphagus TaxID=2641541 RepID=UPI000C381778|nr:MULTISPECIES: (2Fe-2S)-binding protein [unclassified Algoriphagus]MAL13090.1 (2Fe-2S)-binding protein [Algoriphagus sp.]MAL15318.1 (2Fe-2S)-binding protein [Algoriphagus sp.]QYH39438.1 (2Fe-2S)-binding protein [Algoriphagus sp. NBT04N3]HAD50679.1 (2Fe-2S)-binding protein [Algoriphagus sp.]HAH36601.1 (2Fe-2S)-binding protein [Algoriphagus sp.]